MPSMDFTHLTNCGPSTGSPPSGPFLDELTIVTGVDTMAFAGGPLGAYGMSPVFSSGYAEGPSTTESGYSETGSPLAFSGDPSCFHYSSLFESATKPGMYGADPVLGPALPALPLQSVDPNVLAELSAGQGGIFPDVPCTQGIDMEAISTSAPGYMGAIDMQSVTSGTSFQSHSVPATFSNMASPEDFCLSLDVDSVHQVSGYDSPAHGWTTSWINAVSNEVTGSDYRDAGRLAVGATPAHPIDCSPTSPAVQWPRPSSPGMAMSRTNSESLPAALPQTDTEDGIFAFSPVSGRRQSEDSELGAVRTHHWYQVPPAEDGLYHCPLEVQGCRHRAETLKCNYHKHIDSHLKPYRCKLLSCSRHQFSSTACLLRHEREAHGMHGHGEKPFSCPFKECERSLPGNGFPRKWNLVDHKRRVHRCDGEPLHSTVVSAAGPKAPEAQSKRKVGASKRPKPRKGAKPAASRTTMDVKPPALSSHGSALCVSAFDMDQVSPVASQQPIYKVEEELQYLTSRGYWDSEARWEGNRLPGTARASS